MTPDDPRHGTPAGYRAHQHAHQPSCQPCRDAKAAYQRRLTKEVQLGRRRWIPALGTQRRLQALIAIGWTGAAIARELGWRDARRVHEVIEQRHRVSRSTARAVHHVFARLCMTPGPSNRARLRAARRGWPPPLAWDDIDHDPTPAAPAAVSDYDPVVVERILGGDWRLPATADERREVLRRWLASGRSGNELGRRTGWGKVNERYREVAA